MDWNWPPIWPVITANEMEAVSECLRSEAWSRGLSIQKFEKSFASFLGVEHALTVTNATHGLFLALQALGVGPGDEVIVPALTWWSTASAVLDCGALPVLADIDKDTYCLSVQAVEALLTDKTKAIIPVHLYCSATQMDELMNLGKMYGVCIIEDAAQCHGAQWGGQALGCIGDIGVFSFHEKKLLPAGEGGCVVTNNPVLFERLHELRDHGTHVPGYKSGVSHLTGSNYRMTTIQAAILLVGLNRLPEIIYNEGNNAALLKSEIGDICELQPLSCPLKINVRTYYSYCFRLSSIERLSFIRHVENRTGIKWSPAYISLGHKFRDFCFQHPLGSRLYDAIEEPTVPVAELAGASEGVRFPHQVLLADPEQIVWFGKMIRKAIADC